MICSCGNEYIFFMLTCTKGENGVLVSNYTTSSTYYVRRAIVDK